MQTDENLITTIQKEKDYSKFSFIVGNRDIKPDLVKEYKEMLEKGYPHCECPILVTKNLEILDGQHRFLAAKEKNTPIFYIVSSKSADSDAMVDINKAKGGWDIRNYVKHFSERKNEHYQNLQEFCLKNKISYGIALICFSYKRKDLNKVIKDGSFKFDINKKIEAEKWISKYREFLSRCVMAGEKIAFQTAASFSFLEAVLSAKNKKENMFDVLFSMRTLLNHCSGFKGYVRQFFSLGCCDE